MNNKSSLFISTRIAHDRGNKFCVHRGISFAGVQLPPTSDLKKSDLVTAHFADITTGAKPDRRKGVGEGWTWYLLFGDRL